MKLQANITYDNPNGRYRRGFAEWYPKDFIRSQGLEIYTPDLAAFRSHVQAQYLGSEAAASWPDGVLEQINALGN